jgi:hypothetical protein
MEPYIVTPLQGRTIHALLFDLGRTLWIYVQPPHWEQLELEVDQRISSIIEHLRDLLTLLPKAGRQ